MSHGLRYHPPAARGQLGPSPPDPPYVSEFGGQKVLCVTADDLTRSGDWLAAEGATILNVHAGSSDMIDLSLLGPVAGELLGFSVNDFGRAEIVNLPDLPKALCFWHDGSRTDSRLDLSVAPRARLISVAWGKKVSGEFPPTVRRLQIINSLSEDLSCFAHLFRLRLLELRGVRRLLSLDGAGALTALRSLRIADAPKLTSLRGISRHPALVDVDLTNCRRMEVLPSGDWPPDLIRLCLTGVPNLTDLEFLSRLPKLRSVFLSGTRILSGSIGPLFALPDLRGAFVFRRRLYAPTAPLPCGKICLMDSELSELGLSDEDCFYD